MRILKESLLITVPALMAGYIAWALIPCQPERSIRVPFGTKLVEFSPTGRYVVTLQVGVGRLTLWRAETGQEEYWTEMPAYLSEFGVRDLYTLSSDDRWLAVASGSLDELHLVIVDLASSNAAYRVAALPPPGPNSEPWPTFSTDGRYLSYFRKDTAVLYDIGAHREQLRVPGISSSFGAPTRQGKWFLGKWSLEKGTEIECWDVIRGQRQGTLPPWPQRVYPDLDVLTPGDQAVMGFGVAECTQFPGKSIFLYRYDLTTRKMETVWEYPFSPSACLSG